MTDIDFQEVADALLSGRYSLLTGAGVSLDSKNHDGDNLLSGAGYLRFISEKKGLPAKYALQDVYSMMDDDEIELLVTKMFYKCSPGPTVSRLPQYVWNRIFTFNIDDATEAAYEMANPKPQQSVTPLNFTDIYSEQKYRDTLQVIHLHGFTRRPDDKYVFSKDDYIRMIKSNNQWISVLSQFIKSEPFIIAGTSLDEIDLRYYLTFRDESAAAGVRAPSILIEPNPDPMTAHKCNQYGLVLFQGTALDFFDKFSSLYPNIPRLDSNVPVSAATMFSLSPDKGELHRLLADFTVVERVSVSMENVQSNFLFGAKPEWADFERNYDLDRPCNNKLRDELRKFLGGAGTGLLHIICDEAGAGKTTAAERVLYDLAVDGATVLVGRADRAPDLDLAVKLLNTLRNRAIVYFDQGADAASWVASLYERLDKTKVCFVVSERVYRERHIKTVTSGIPYSTTAVGKTRVSEYKKLIKAYGQRGLIGDERALKNPGQFARLLQKDPIALGVCRILNDFAPIDQIASTLLRDSSDAERKIFLLAALASYCSHFGIRYSILNQVVSHAEIKAQAKSSVPLPIMFREYDGKTRVEPGNQVMAERILLRAKTMVPSTLKSCFFVLGEGIAPFVNRLAITQQTPEARVAARLFDYDEVLEVLIPGGAEEFLLGMEKLWAWNSRYWEQKAILMMAKHIKTSKKGAMSDYLRDAVAYAKHAVSVERHQYPLNTLGNVLMARYDVKGENKEQVFTEAFGCYDEAIRMEKNKSRVTVHPLKGIFRACLKVVEGGGGLGADQIAKLREHVTSAKAAYRHDRDIITLTNQIIPWIT